MEQGSLQSFFCKIFMISEMYIVSFILILRKKWLVFLPPITIIITEISY